MDTKLKSYNEGGNAGWMRALLCWLSGGVFLFAGAKLMISICRVATLYDMHYFFLVEGFKDEAAYRASEAYAKLNADLPLAWKLTAVFGIIACIALVVCCIACRSKINWFDKIFTELQIIAFAAAAPCMVFCAMEYGYGIHRTAWLKNFVRGMNLKEKQIEALTEFKGWYWLQADQTAFNTEWVEVAAFLGGAVVLLAVCLIILVSWVRKLKARCFWKSSLIGVLYKGIRDAFRDSKGIQGKIIGLLIVGAILSATWVGLIFVIGAIIFLVPKQIKKYKAIRDGVESVKNGNLDCKIETLGADEKPGELDRLAMDINEISAATAIAVSNELKNQRLKTDLISSVSHDLKTPLTSMITYVDLLKKEGLDSENAGQYLEIIDEKTKRLQKLTEDLFEAAKASSGAIPVNMERIDMQSIVGQALGELEGRLAAADLDVIFENKTGDAGTFVLADGQLLWRVMENLLVNASKYALPGSRVYVDLRDCGDECLVMEMKNMSKDRLNIDAEELLERFKRGDESRNTEGSGLGLAIARDLVTLMDGDFFIKVDGDLFKVSVVLKKA